MNERVKKILDETQKGLKPPTDEELNQAMAKWLFGKNADKMMKYAPWSFVLTKIMWLKGEEPWKS